MDWIKTIMDLINVVLEGNITTSNKELITKIQLKEIYGISDSVANNYFSYLNTYMQKYNINTKARITAFVAQIGHESGRLKYTTEIWGPTTAQVGYEGRKDLGNIQVGDGSKFRGRGLIQITGRTNYELVSKALGQDFINNPTLLATPEYAVESACWWWSQRKYKTKTLNEWADENTEVAFQNITRGINGGLNGYQDRLELWNKAKIVL